jgi:gliding motility associated protien GldN
MSKRALLLVFGLATAFGTFGQEVEAQFDPNSTLRIPRYEQLYKVRVWRDVDLREKQNKGFFAVGNEITKLVLNAINSGELADIYQNDSLVAKIGKEALQSKLVASQADPNVAAWDPNRDYYSTDVVIFEGKNYEALTDNKGKNPGSSKDEWTVTTRGKAVPFLPSQIFQMNIKEDVIFDKRRSRLYYDILAVGFQVFDENAGFFRDIGWFRYKDLEKVFRNHPEEAIWFNRYNTAENKNYADAFLLRLFKGNIKKIENPDDNDIFSVYTNRKEAVMAMEWEELKMMEREHNLWEY